MDGNFFEKLQDTIGVAGQEITYRAKDIKDKAKLQYEIRQREGYLKELYIELGKKYYSEHKDDEGEDFEEIETLLCELSDLRGEWGNMKGAKECPHCGAQVPNDSEYCNKCGTPLNACDVDFKDV